MPAVGDWASYFWPDTIDPATGSGVLRNLFGVREGDLLHDLEYAAVASRQRRLLAGEVRVDRTFDGAHLRAIHGWLFQDVYEWAGRFRTVNITKGPGRGFAEAGSGEIDRYLADAHRLIRGTDWAGLDRDGFAIAAASVFAFVNQAHPFREGNGRTSKVFLTQVAERSRWRLDFALVAPGVWNQASALSGPDLYSYAPVPDALVPVFAAITVDRPPPGEAPHSSMSRGS